MLRLLLLLSAWAAGAGIQEPGFAPEDTVRNTIEQKLGDQETRRTAGVAAKYGVLEADVRALRAARYSWGDVENTLAIALEADRPVSEIMRLRDRPLSWKEVARRYGLKLAEARARAPRTEPETLRDAIGEPSRSASPLRRFWNHLFGE